MKRPRFAKLAIFASVLLGFCTFGATKQNTDTPREIDISAKRYEFTPNEITVKRGESVVLVLHSEDVTHGLQIKELGIKTDVPTGKGVEIPLTATDVGDFNGMCNHFCGMGHGGMTFVVHVVDQ